MIKKEDKKRLRELFDETEEILKGESPDKERLKKIRDELFNIRKKIENGDKKGVNMDEFDRLEKYGKMMGIII